MKEYIEREQAIALFYPVDPENDGSDGCTIVYKSGNFSSSEIEAMLSDLPAANVAEVRHGRWIPEICESISKRNRLIEYKVYSCSLCGRSNGRVKKKYCPNCGALMMEVEHDKYPSDPV